MKSTLGILLMAGTPYLVVGQQLEIDGEIKIAEMVKSNTADSIVIVLSDGTLGVRDATSLSDLLNTADSTNELQTLSEVLMRDSSAADGRIKELRDPIEGQDAATKAYVDQLLDIIQTLQNGAYDGEGQHYNAVLIGDQVWLARNLSTTKYNDGTPIPLVEDPGVWGDLVSPAYSWYNNDSATYAQDYGALYNFYVIDDTNNLKICPAGWHIPTDSEWTELIDYLDPANVDPNATIQSTVAGGKMKERGTSHWTSPNVGATNASRFNGIPGGFRTATGTFSLQGLDAYWWSGTTSSTSEAWYRYVANFDTFVLRTEIDKKIGFSVRCLKD